MAGSSWVVQLTEELDKNIEASRSQVSTWSKRSIYKVPKRVTKLNPNAYIPQVVSFGPYHHGEPHLNPMEEHKCRALDNYIKRSRGKTSRDLIGAISEVLQDLKDNYDDVRKEQTDEGFVKLMILDGCFMVEVLRTWSETGKESKDGDSNDPIFSEHGKLQVVPYIRRDMLMLENQLPMLVLYKLVEFEGKLTFEPAKDHVHKLILKFFQPELPLPDKCLDKYLHVLDVYRWSLTREDPSCKTRHPRVSMFASPKDTIIWSATELDESGIKFKASKTLSLKDISFSKGVLRLPTVTIDDTTESAFLNLIAFERFHVGAGNEISVYILTMNNIIDNERDVALLHSKGIIRSFVGSDKEVASLFNSLSRDVTLDENSDVMLVHWSVNAYSKQPWNKWRANFMKTYFRNPWVTISLIAAIIFFILTTLETATNFFPVK